MKRLILYGSFALLIGSISACGTTNPGYYGGSGYDQPQGQVSVNTFYDELSPYGQWMDYGNYGRVWRPNVGQDFRPYYTNGNWVYSDYGWTWNSNYNWGWAPFHYGRWMMDNSYGWMWIPGTEWGPAWVNWRSNNDYYGWAPMGPGVNIGVNINVPMNQWAFIPSRYMGDPYMNRYYVPYSNYGNIYNNTTFINNTYVVGNRRYYRGPDLQEVESITRRRINPVRVVNNGRPGASLTRNELRTYRPDLNNNGGPTRSSAGSTRSNNGQVNRNDDYKIAPRRNWDRENTNGTRTYPNNTDGNRPRRIFDNSNGNGNVNPTPTPTPANPNSNNGGYAPRRVFDNSRQPAVTPTPDRPQVTPAPSTPAPRRVFEQPSTPRPQPQPQPQRIESRPTPAPTPAPATPAPAPSNRRAGATRG